MTNGQRFHIKLTQFVKLLGLSSHLAIPMKLHTGRVMAPKEMAPTYISNNGFRAPRIDGILPHFVVLHKMRRRTLAPRIGDSNAILTYEWNLHDALMKYELFDVFDYIINEIWNIDINSQRSCGFALYIMCMIKMVAHERFYKDEAHEPLHPAVLKDPRSRRTSPPPDVTPTRTTHSGGASSSFSINFGFLEMFQGIFAMCQRTNQHMDVMETHLDIVHHNQEIIHS
jgi:hypothetical protein